MACAGRGRGFALSAGGRKFFSEEGFMAPERCREWRRAKREQRGERGGGPARAESRRVEE